MRAHSPATQTLYAQVLEATAAYDLDLVGGFAQGFAVERAVRKRTYLYWQIRDVTGHLRQVYLGPALDARAQGLRESLETYKERRRPILADLQRLSAAYVASGGAAHLGGHFPIVDALARAGIFRAGALLVGSHAFVSIGASLGVTWSGDTIATADVDISRDAFVTIACESLRAIDIPGVLQQVDPTFFLVPELDLKTPSSSMMSRSRGVKVDLLTTAKTPRDARPRVIAALGLAAQPLRYMDYLVLDEVARALFIGPHAILVNVPHAGRFALHKLAVSVLRAGGPSSIKAEKDRRQAEALILALAERQPGALALAADAARAHRDRGLARDIAKGARRISREAQGHVALLR
ncbi:MAG: GSU2403 family nucleotidyltransferase fold protein [Polyangiaceae bacterium]